MTLIITLSIDQETLEKFEELAETMDKNKSASFRDMVKYFHTRKGQLRDGIIVEEAGK